MRMHRGSSKGAADDAAPEILPLSASPRRVRVEFTITRGGSVETHGVEVEAGATLRAALRALGRPPEACAVLDGETPLPLDTPVTADRRLTLVPTFSGG